MMYELYMAMSAGLEELYRYNTIAPGAAQVHHHCFELALTNTCCQVEGLCVHGLNTCGIEFGGLATHVA
jgi:hypothetical protein